MPMAVATPFKGLYFYRFNFSHLCSNPIRAWMYVSVLCVCVCVRACFLRLLDPEHKDTKVIQIIGVYELTRHHVAGDLELHFLHN
jgi:hypothetical protein